MKCRFVPSIARGYVQAPPSKSMAHRALFCAALADGTSRIGPIAPSEDMLATVDALSALGATFAFDGEYVTVQGAGGIHQVKDSACCRESGSTLRFCVPLCLLSGKPITLTGAGRLMARPMGVYEDLCRERGFLYRQSEEGITLCGELTPGEYAVPGNISSQFITGLLLALPLLSGDSVLRVTGQMESAAYIDMTLQAMADFGVEVTRKGSDFYISGGSSYRCRNYTVEGDYSNAAMIDGFTLLGGDVRLNGLREDSLQGDRIYRRFYEELKNGCPTLDLKDCPDLGPAVIALAAALHGAVLIGTGRLKIKESDRGAAMAAELKKCGVDLVLEENRIIVPGGKLCPPKEPITGHNDHRIVMAMGLLLSRLGGQIEGAEAVRKSFPDYFDIIRKLGIEVIEE